MDTTTGMGIDFENVYGTIAAPVPRTHPVAIMTRIVKLTRELVNQTVFMLIQIV